MKSVNAGTKIFLDYTMALAKLDKQERDELVSRGLVVADLGTASTPQWRFVATVARSGAVTVVEVRPGQPDPVSAPFPERSARDLETIRALDEEFGERVATGKEPEDE